MPSITLEFPHESPQKSPQSQAKKTAIAVTKLATDKWATMRQSKEKRAAGLFGNFRVSWIERL
jgi:hypothetical protein